MKIIVMIFILKNDNYLRDSTEARENESENARASERESRDDSIIVN